MSDKFQIVITGSNQAHQAFAQLTQDAKAAGLSVQQMGENSSRSLTQLNQRAAAFGAALGGATLLMGEFAKSAAEDEASVARLNASVESTGASVDEYSASLEVAIKAGQKKAFTDDQTRDAVVRLNLATNDTSKSIDELSLAMDLSRAKGISLGTAAEVIGKVMGGNLGILTRYGIILDSNATKEEALAAIQQRVAGQASAYSTTNLGKLDIAKDKIDELTESWGAHAGALQSVLLLLPGLQAGYVALAGVVGGMGGLGAIAKYGGPAAAVAGIGALAYGYSQDTLGTTQINSLANQFFLTMSNAINALTPGNAFDTSKYTAQMATNAQWDAVNSVLQGAGMTQGQTVEQLRVLLGVPWTYDPNGGLMNYGQSGGSQTTGAWNPPSNEEVLAAATRAASNRGMPLADYIRYVASSSGMAVDPVTGMAMSQAAYGSAYQSRVGAQYGYTGPGSMAFGAFGGRTDPYGGQGIYNPFPSRGGTVSDYYGPTPTAYRAGGMGAVANDVSGMGGAPVVLSQANQDLANAANAKLYSAALREQYGAYAKLVEGVDLAKGASMAFKATQDGLIDSEKVYGGQISEYTSQIDSMSAAHDILNQRVEEGGTLTKQQQDFQDNYNKALERGTGGVEDATLAQGQLAEQYLLNMEQGDKLNETMQGNTESTASLVTAIDDLILSMTGVPEEVRTRIELDGYEKAYAEAVALQAALSLAAGTYIANFVVNRVGGNAPSGPQYAHGGVVGYDNGGVVIHAGEAGPEFMRFQDGGSAWANTDGLYSVPRGTYVTPAPASRGRGGGGHTFHLHGAMTIVANDPRQMAAAINEWAVGSSRS